MGLETKLAGLSSLVIRVLGPLFLLVVPGPSWVPVTIFTAAAVYVNAFLVTLRRGPRMAVAAKEVDVTIRDTVAVDGDAAEPVVVAEEVDVEETVVMVEKPPSPLRALLTGVPDAKTPVATFASFLLNALLVLASVDFLYGARYRFPSEDLSFVRLGHVSHTEAKFLIREPDQARMPVSLEIRIKDPRPPFDNTLWSTAGSLAWTTNDTDYTAVVTAALRHSQQRIYEWRTSNNHSGEFAAPPRPGAASEYHGGRFTFLASSCMLPHFPYNPLDHPLSIPGLRHLARRLPGLGAQFMLFMGDFIYVDVPRRLGSSVEDYRMKYRQVYASPDWAGVGQNLSWVHVVDDHEIANDWSANSTGLYRTAMDPYQHYHVAANPPPARMAGSRIARPGARYFEFTQGPASFFLLDTRSPRSDDGVAADSTDKTMLGREQLEDLLAWLRRPEPRGVRWKIVASSVPFTKNWPVNRKDTWGGFLRERALVLEAMWDAAEQGGFGVVVLSGDRHEFAATRFPPPEGGRWSEGAAVHEFSASPLSMFASPVGTYRQTDEEDVMVKYIHSGVSKFGALAMEKLAEGDRSSLRYTLYVDGEEAWNTTLVTPLRTEETATRGSFWSRIGLA